MRLVLAEDHALLRAGLIQLLENNDFTILHEVDNATDLAEALLDPEAEAAVVDVRLPPTQSDEGLVAAITARLPQSSYVPGGAPNRRRSCRTLAAEPSNQSSTVPVACDIEVLDTVVAGKI